MGESVMARIEYIDAAGARIAVTRTGRGAPIVCLHATGHGARDYARLAARLGDRFEFHAIDWPGQGESPREATPASAARYAELLAGAMEALALERALIIGNSIGGAAALIYAAAKPARVRGLILCNPGGLQAVSLPARLICRSKARFFARGEGGAADFPRRFRRYYERTVLPLAASAWRREEIIAAAARTAPVLREAWESFADPAADLRALPAALSCPVLYAWARRDALVSWSRCRKAALRARDCEAALLDAGHCAFLEQPDAFEALMLSFAARAPV
jgi:pimeloyl-ACP methyl ester carboxylesterase